MGHSFIRRLRDFIVKNAPDYHLNLNLTDSVTVQLHGVGGRTIAEVRQFDLGEVIRFRPDIVFRQIGTNDLVQRGMSPLTVGQRTLFVVFMTNMMEFALYVKGRPSEGTLVEILMTVSDCLPSILRLCWSRYPLPFIGQKGFLACFKFLLVLRWCTFQ